MKKLVVVAALSLSMTAPAFAMEIKDYPRSLDELEYCAKAQMDSDIEVPEGCMTLGQRIYSELKSM